MEKQNETLLPSFTQCWNETANEPDKATTGLTEQAGGGELGGSAFACPLHLNSKHPYYQLPTKKQLSNKLTRVVAIQSSSTSNGLHIYTGRMVGF